MTDVILDSSAVLAHLRNEPGGEMVQSAFAASAVSAVNFAEIITKLIEWNARPEEAENLVGFLGYAVLPADRLRALAAGLLHARTRGTGVSLGDRFCLALAQELGLPVLTADRRWKGLDIGVEINLIR